MIAFAFPQHWRLAQASRETNDLLTAAPAEPDRHPTGHRRSLDATAPAQPIPALPTMDQTTAPSGNATEVIGKTIGPVAWAGARPACAGSNWPRHCPLSAHLRDRSVT